MPRKDRTFTGLDLYRIANNNLDTQERRRLLVLLCGEAPLVEQDPTDLIRVIVQNIRDPLRILREVIDIIRD